MAEEEERKLTNAFPNGFFIFLSFYSRFRLVKAKNNLFFRIVIVIAIIECLEDFFCLLSLFFELQSKTGMSNVKMSKGLRHRCYTNKPNFCFLKEC